MSRGRTTHRRDGVRGRVGRIKTSLSPRVLFQRAKARPLHRQSISLSNNCDLFHVWPLSLCTAFTNVTTFAASSQIHQLPGSKNCINNIVWKQLLHKYCVYVIIFFEFKIKIKTWNYILQPFCYQIPTYIRFKSSVIGLYMTYMYRRHLLVNWDRGFTKVRLILLFFYIYQNGDRPQVHYRLVTWLSREKCSKFHLFVASEIELLISFGMVSMPVHVQFMFIVF